MVGPWVDLNHRPRPYQEGDLCNMFASNLPSRTTLLKNRCGHVQRSVQPLRSRVQRSKEPLWQREQHGVGRGHGPAEIGAYAGHGEIVGGCALAIDAELDLVVEDCGALTANSA